MKEKQNTGRWSKEEDKMLIEYVRRNGPRNWKYASDYVKNRNPKQCRERWDGHLKPGINKKPFNRKEELEIIRLREREHSRWRDIAKKIGNGRTPNAIKNVYTQQLSKRVRRPLKIEGYIKGFKNNTKPKISVIKESHPHMKLSYITN
nr:5486_t:CDS:2 [Entrophospora candida]